MKVFRPTRFASLAIAVLLSASLLGACARSRGTQTGPLPGDQQAMVNGVPLRYHVSGSGPVMVVHPGGPGLTSAYLRMPALERSFTLVYLDPVGTGDSGRIPAGKYTFERYASDLDGLREALRLERMWLLGHSYGGMIAQVYASTYPDRLDGLALYSTSPRQDEEWSKGWEAMALARKDEPGFADAMATFGELEKVKSDAEMTSMYRRWAPFYFFGDYLGHRAEYDPVIARIDATLDPNLPLPMGPEYPFDLRPRLSKIRARTLILAGRTDHMNCGADYAEEMRQGIAGSRVVVLERSGHMAHVEEPEAFAAAVREFLAARR